MEAGGRLQHRTNSEPSTGWNDRASVLTNVTPSIRCPGPQGNPDHDMDEILWHRRESRRQTEKTNIVL